MIVQSGVKHVSVFWLKDPTDVDKALEQMKRLAELPQVLSFVAGPPVDHDWPAMKIDKSWHVGMCIELRDIDACRDYFNDPIHQEAAGTLIELAERVFPFYIDY